MSQSLEQRVEVLEKQVAQLAKRQNGASPFDQTWLNDIYGKFANDPVFDEAMKLGRKYRESLRPRARKPRR